jgi:hypothetical protein
MRDPDAAQRRAAVPEGGLRGLEDLGRLGVAFDDLGAGLAERWQSGRMRRS